MRTEDASVSNPSARAHAATPLRANDDFHVERPGGHLDQMIRQTRAHHVQLSTMADQKAGTLMTLCTIGIPLTLQLLDNPDLRLPAIVLICCNLVTVLLAAMTVMPRLAPLRRADTRNPLFNPLFFGDFAKLTYDEYVDEMQKVVHDPTATYEVQLREVYAMGLYLAKRKFFYLKCAFLTFLVGVFSAAAVWLFGQLAG